MSKKAQLMFCSLLFLLIIYICVLIGQGEYDKEFCEDKLKDKLLDTDKVALLIDYVTPHTHGVNIYNEKYSYGCCRIPKGETRISKSQNCVYAENYKKPTIKQKIDYFLKKFI